jgi:iron complex outermembrane receptor protein
LPITFPKLDSELFMHYLQRVAYIIITSTFLYVQTNAQVDTVYGPTTFELGEVKITARIKDAGTFEIWPQKIEQFDRKNVAEALQLIPGLTYVNSGPRNEAMITVRGFDLRQVPVYLDGIPVYVMYDGYVDLGNFLVQDLAKIAVSKGVSSILYGPNTLGGAINLVTRKPENKLEFEGSTGLYAGHGRYNGWHSEFHTGSRLKKFYFQAGYSLLDRDSYSLSNKYEPPYPGYNGILDNSDRRDMKLNFKAGLVPNSTDEYALSLMTQQSTKGIPVYAGTDPDQRVRYWRFPDYDNSGINFISKTSLEPAGFLKTRVFYERYYSDLRSYDDSTYTSQERGSSFTSIYFDDSFGGSVEYNMDFFGAHNLKAAVHYKYDHHREHNTHPVNETVRHMKDQYISLGLEENFTPVQNILIIGGVSYDFRDNIQADNYDAQTDSIFPFPANRDAALNAQIGLDYNISEIHNIRISLARKTRFGTMKDRYSYRLGRSLPNPTLKSESALHADISYSLTKTNLIQLEASLFYSLLNDVIQEVYGVDPDNSAVYQLQNTGKAVFYGLETDAAIIPDTSFMAGLSYTYLKRKNLSRPELIFTNVPEHKVFGYLKYEKPTKFYILFNSGFNSERPSTSDGLYVAEAFFISNIKVSIKVWKIFVLEAGINNLFDVSYCYYEGYPEEGRNFEFTIRYSFGKN